MIDLGGPGFVADWVAMAATNPADYSIMAQFIVQAKAVGVTVVWTAVVAFIAFKIADLIVGLRVSDDEHAKVTTSWRTVRALTTGKRRAAVPIFVDRDAATKKALRRFFSYR